MYLQNLKKVLLQGSEFAVKPRDCVIARLVGMLKSYMLHNQVNT